MAEAALLAARQVAAREAAAAKLARQRVAFVNRGLENEMAVRAAAQSRLAHLAGHAPLTAAAGPGTAGHAKIPRLPRNRFVNVRHIQRTATTIQGCVSRNIGRHVDPWVIGYGM